MVREHLAPTNPENGGGAASELLILSLDLVKNRDENYFNQLELYIYFFIFFWGGGKENS